MSIGENLRVLREKKGYTQITLAKKIGLSQGMVAQLERGTKTLSLPLAIDLSEILECSVMDFIQERKEN